VQTYLGFEQIIGAVERIKEILPDFEKGPGLNFNKLEKLKGSLEIYNLSFTYNQSKAGVFDINLYINEGDVVGIIGPNGSGKSTLVDLLSRFYEPQQGHIILGGHKSAEVDIEVWRGQFAVLTREPYLFDVSVFDNVALASANASHDKVIEAFQNSGLQKVVESLPQGYDTHVGESGILLSTGQRQLVALARIFLQNPSVVILDEALVSLDPDVHDTFVEALKAWKEDRIVIITSHKFDNTWPYTQLVHLQGGRVVKYDQLGSSEKLRSGKLPKN
ncbi:hypothetical protein BVY01_01520, partial [bacterium I07]